MQSQESSSTSVLCYEQVSRLHEVMERVIPVHGRGNFPTLEVKLSELVNLVKQKLKSENVNVRDVRVNGGAASFIVGRDKMQRYNDLDLIFGVELRRPSDFHKIKTAVLDSLLDFLPDGVNKDKMSSCSLKEAYVQKMVKVCSDTDRWSLISLSNNKGKNVELKFTDTIKRQFEFSVDSFQIELDSLLKFYEISSRPMTEHFYPTVTANSVFGPFEEALYHLNNKLIATWNPEEIRGGGLFKYCNLLVRQYSVASSVDTQTLQRYMCSRFFIDFPDITQQKQKLLSYLVNHFNGDDTMIYAYLLKLHQVINESTICLMGHERRQTLGLIQQMAYEILWNQEQKARCKQMKIQQFDMNNCHNRNVLFDQIYYGDNVYPQYDMCNNVASYPNAYAVGMYTPYQVTPSCPTCCASYLQCSG